MIFGYWTLCTMYTHTYIKIFVQEFAGARCQVAANMSDCSEEQLADPRSTLETQSVSDMHMWIGVMCTTHWELRARALQLGYTYMACSMHTCNILLYYRTLGNLILRLTPEKSD